MGRHGLPLHYCSTSHYSPPVSCSGRRRRRKARATGTPKRGTREETIDIDMSSPPAAATFDIGATYAPGVYEEALRLAARRESSSGRADHPWVRDPRSGIWTMGGPSVGEAKLWPHEDTEIRGVYSHSRGNRSLAGIRLGGVIASDVGDAVRIQDLPGVKIPYCDANAANLDRFILD